MAKAEIVLKDGTKMNIEGTPDEIMQIKEHLEKSKVGNLSSEDKDPKKDFGISSQEGPLSRIYNLIKEGFFKEKRTLADIKSKLEEKAIFYDVTSLSPTLLRLVKRGIIRRIKEEGQLRYVNL
jgi:hypothetical protein